VKKRLPIAIAALSLILLGISLALPRTHYAIQGWLHGEAYFDSQPTSYWLGAIKKEPFVGDQGDVFKKLREGGPAAVPVLCQLFMDEDGPICQQASLAISLIDWERQGMTPAVAEALVSVDTPDLFQRTAARLSNDNRIALKEGLARELKDKARPRSRGAAALALALLGNDDSGLLRLAMVDGAIPVRVRAAILLWHSNQHTDDVVWTLVTGLQSPAPKIRAVASGALRQIGPSANDTVRSAVIGFLPSNDPSVRENAVSILGRMVLNEDATNALLQALRDEDVLVRYEASAALANEKVHVAKESMPILLAALDDTRESRPRTTWRFQYVRSNIVWILGRLGGEDRAVLDTLVHTLRDDPDWPVRSAAVSALAKFAPRSLEVVHVLAEAARRDHQPGVRIHVADELKRMGKEAASALPALIASLLEDHDVMVRWRAGSAVAEIATDESQLQSLLTALKDSRKESVRVSIAQALGQIKFRSPKVVGGLVQALEDKDVQVRLAAAASLARADPENAAALHTLRQVLVKKEEKSNPITPTVFVNDAEGPIRVATPDLDIRRQAIQILARYGAAAKPALPDLIGLLGEKDTGQHLPVIQALGAIGPDAKQALPKIKEQLKNPAPSYRLFAAQALWKIDRNAEPTVPVLIDVMNDKFMASWRVSAANTLAEIGPAAKAAIPTLRELSADTSPEVQKAARQALAKINGEPSPKDEPDLGAKAPSGSN